MDSSERTTRKRCIKVICGERKIYEFNPNAENNNENQIGMEQNDSSISMAANDSSIDDMEISNGNYLTFVSTKKY